MTLTRQELEVLYNFLLDHKVVFISIFVKNMAQRAYNMQKGDYGNSSKDRKEGLPYGSLLTHIFWHFGVDFSRCESVKVKPTQFTRKEILKTTKIYMTKIREYFFLPYIRDEDEMDDKRDPKPSKAQQLFIQMNRLVDVKDVNLPLKPLRVGKRRREGTSKDCGGVVSYELV